jgi:Phage integrase family
MRQRRTAQPPTRWKRVDISMLPRSTGKPPQRIRLQRRRQTITMLPQPEFKTRARCTSAPRALLKGEARAEIRALPSAEGTSRNAYIVLALLIWRANGGAASAHLGSAGSGGGPADHSSVALRPSRWPDEDRQVSSHIGVARPMHRGASQSQGRTDQNAARGRRLLERAGPGVLHRQGSALDAANVRRSFRQVASAAGLNPKEWTPRELRHSFVSLLSSSGVSIEEIAHLVGHGSTSVTERVYRKELRPVITPGARAMNKLFNGDAKR